MFLFFLFFLSLSLSFSSLNCSFRWPQYCRGESVDYCPNRAPPFSSTTPLATLATTDFSESWYAATIRNVNSLSPGSTSTDQKYVLEITGDGEEKYDVSRENLRRHVSSTEAGRAKSCNACTNCLAPECGHCHACMDMPKRGGPNLAKQRCDDRRCKEKIQSREWRVGKVEGIPVEMEVDPNAPRKVFVKGREPGKRDKRKTKGVGNATAKASTKHPNLAKGVTFPKKNAMMKFWYATEGGWIYGQVLNSYPSVNELEIDYETGEQVIESTIILPGGTMDDDVRVVERRAFEEAGRVVPFFEWEVEFLFFQCGECKKWRKVSSGTNGGCDTEGGGQEDDGGVDGGGIKRRTTDGERRWDPL